MFINIVLLLGVYFNVLQNLNFVSVVLMIFLCLFLSNFEFNFIKIVISIFSFSFLCYLETRSVILGLFLGVFLVYFPLTAVIIIFSLVVLFFYLYQISFFDTNTPFFLYNGKAFEQGRVVIWEKVLNSMNGTDHIWGLGGGVNYTTIIENHLSVHSGFLYIYSSYGIIGLILILLVIYQVWNKYRKHSKFALIIFYTLIFREFFEVTLFSNNFPISIVFWSILFGMSSFSSEELRMIAKNVTKSK